MVLDSSVLIAISRQEPGFERLVRAIEDAAEVFAGAPTLVETSMVLSTRLHKDARPFVDEMLKRFGVTVIPFDAVHAQAAGAAFLRFGRGWHRAALNFGDCMSYAVASVAGLPLLYAGKDFAETDIVSVDLA